MVNLLNLETTVHVLCIIIWNPIYKFLSWRVACYRYLFLVLYLPKIQYLFYSNSCRIFPLVIVFPEYNSSPTEIVKCVTFEGACRGIFQNEVTIVSYIIPKNVKTFKKEHYKSSRAIPWSFLWTPMVTFVSPNIFVKIYTDP